MAFQYIPDDDTKYEYLYPPPGLALKNPNAKRVRRYGPDGPSGGPSDEKRSLMTEGWTKTRWAQMLYHPDSTKEEIISKVFYSPDQVTEAIEEGWTVSPNPALHPHAEDKHRQRFLKAQETKKQAQQQRQKTA